MNKTVIQTNNAPKNIGIYSQGIIAGEIVFVSGQIAIDPETGKLLIDNIKSETIRIMENISEILKAAEMDFTNIIKCSIFLKDIKPCFSL